jgi:hypothetical protein
MESEAIARASLLDLEGGVVVSVPGVPDESVVDGIAAASSRVLAFTRTVDLPSRYQ